MIVYCWVIDGKPFKSIDKHLVPKGIEPQEFETENPSDIIYDPQAGQWRIKTEAEKLRAHKERAIKEIDDKAQEYINKTFKSLDWGDDEADALTSIGNTIDVLLGKILFLLIEDLKNQNKDTSQITVSEFWKKTVLYFAGEYNPNEAIQDLQSLGVTDATIQKVLPLIGELVKTASLKYWDEEVWNYAETIKAQIQKMTSIEEIDQLMSSIQFPPPPGGKG